MRNKAIEIKKDDQGLSLREIELSGDDREPDGEVKLEFLQGHVGGYVQRIAFNSKFTSAGVDVYANEEGKLIGLEPTVAVGQVTTKTAGKAVRYNIVDLLVGSVVFIGHDGRGKMLPLTDEQVALVKRELLLCESEIGMLYLMKYE